MAQYQNVLEKAARQEVTLAVICLVLILALIALIWGCQHLAFRKIKQNSPRAYASEIQKQRRRQSIAAAICLTVFCLALGAGFVISAADTVSKIRKDLDGNTYAIYRGTYHPYDEGTFSKYTLYRRWTKVDLKNGEYVYLYLNSIARWISTDYRSHEGELIYGEHSRIIVDILQ